MKLEAPGPFEEITTHQARAEPHSEGVTTTELVHQAFCLLAD
jgi:hypothetical protein